MNPANAAYNLHAASDIQDTIAVLWLPALSVYLATEPVRGLSVLPYIQDRPALAQSQANPLSGASSIGGVSLQIQDQDGAVTSLRRSSYIRGLEAVLFQGYRGLRWGAFLPALRGKVKGFKATQGGLVYALDVADRFDQADRTVFDPAALAAEPYMDGDRSFDGGSLILRDSDSDGVYDTVILTGNPVDIALKLLISGSDSGSVYDVWPVWAGAGLTEDEVDVAWCLAEQAKVLTVDMTFYLSDQESAKDFVETEICKALGGYSILSGAGKIRIHFPSNPGSSAGLVAIGDSVMVTKPEPSDSSDFHITHVVYRLGDTGDGPTITLRRASPQYLAGLYHGEERVHEIESRGLQVASGGVSVADATIDALFQRYGNPPPRTKFKTFYSQHLIEAGDVLRVTSVYLPDWDGRGPDAERLYEVLSVKPNKDTVEIDGIDLTGPLTAGRRAIIAPNGQADWTSASTTERQYAYIADASTGQLSDGTAAYGWS